MKMTKEEKFEFLMKDRDAWKNSCYLMEIVAVCLLILWTVTLVSLG